MRYVDIISGIRSQISNEESDLLDKIKAGPIANSKLDGREQEVARNLVIKDIIKRFKKDNKVYLRYIDPIPKRN